MEDDIIRQIDESVVADCASEIERLKRKRRGFKAAFTQILNVIDKLIQASTGPDNKINKSESNRLAIERAFEKLELRYEGMISKRSYTGRAGNATIPTMWNR